MIRATCCIDEAVGETRRVLLDSGRRPFRIDIERWSERGARAKLDEVRWGRLGARTPGGRGWFVDLGLDDDGVLETARAGLAEGQMVCVRVKSEAWAEKGPVLSLADIKQTVSAPPQPGLLAAAASDPFLRGVEVIAAMVGREAREAIDAAIDEGLARVAAVPGGGDISIERTRALTAIDVDAGDRKASGADAEMFARNLNLAAAAEAARQISLRGIAGLVAVDFAGMDQRKNRKAVSDAFRDALASWLGRSSEVLDLSVLGVCEAAIARRQRPLVDAHHASPAEREALDAIRELESVGRIDGGARLRGRVSSDAMAWLEADSIGWKKALGDRIGMRWSLDAVARRPGPPEVWSQK